MVFDLTDDETAALGRLLSDAFDRDRYPLSPRIKMLKGLVAKIRPEPPKASLAPKGQEPKRKPLTQPKHYEPPRRANLAQPANGGTQC
jgi:hypothetical protein